MKIDAANSPRLTKAALVRRASGLMALEPRFMFDGAALDTAVDHVLDTSTHADAPAAEAPAQSALFQMPSGAPSITAAAAAQEQVKSYLESITAEQLFAVFNGGKTQPDAQWLAKAESLMASIAKGEYSVDVQYLSGDVMGHFQAAYAQQGPGGKEVIFLNQDWWGDSVADDRLVAVLVEELGHSIDAKLNAGQDTVGDEGERFASLVLGIPAASQASTRVAGEDDQARMWVDGVAYEVEHASFNFVNAYALAPEYRYLAEKEQESDRFLGNALNVARISDNTSSGTFSGNDVVVDLTIGNATYHGWISRPIKDQGIVRGFYFWYDPSFTTFALATADGNQDGDSDAADNRGFVLVVDQAWFDRVLAGTPIKNNGSVATNVYEVGSSSDRVDSALNGVLAPNSPPVAANDVLSLAEDSGTTTVSAANGLLRNDTDANSDTLTVTSFSVGGVSTTVTSTTGGSYVISGMGTVTVNADGSYSFAPVANYSGTVSPITYTVSDGKGGSTTAVLSITVTPVNDPPVSTDDAISISMNTPVLLTLSDFGTYRDQENDPLSKIQITQLPSAGQLESWNGTAWVAVTAGQEFTVSQVLQGQLRFSPVTGQSGSPYTTLQFKVSDGQAYSANPYTLTVNIAAGNSAPVATADAKPVAEAGCDVAAAPATGNVLTNDSDPESQTLSVSEVSFNGAAKTVDGSTTIKGLYGTLTISANGQYSYAVDNALPSVDAMNTGATKTDVFSYSVTDGSNPSSTTLTITINGTNDAPVAQNDFNQMVQGALSGGNYGTVSGNVLTNDTDVDSTLSIGGAYASATGSANGTSTYSFTTSASVQNNYYVFRDSDDSKNGNETVVKVRGIAVQINKTTSTFYIAEGGSNVTVNSSDLGFKVNDNLGFAANLSGDAVGTGNYKTTTVSGVTTAASTTVSLSGVTGVVSTGMTVSDGVNNYTVNSLNYDTNGNVTSAVLNTAVTWSSKTLTFNKTGSPLTLTGRYGNVSISSTGAYTYTMTSNALGAGAVFNEQFSYRATDGACTDDAILTIQLTGTAAPYLQNDRLTVKEDTGAHDQFNGSTVLNNNSLLLTNDANGTNGVTLGNITGFKVEGLSTTYAAGGTATIDGVGTLRITATGLVEFDPVDDYLGDVPAVTYTRTGSDGVAYSARLIINIAAVDDASVLQPDTAKVPPNTTATGNVLANDTDVDSVLSVTQFTFTDGGLQTLAVPSGGSNSYTLANGGVITVYSNGKYTFVPPANWSGDVPQITYTTNTGLTSTLDIKVAALTAPVLDLDANDSTTAAGSKNFVQTYQNASAGVRITDIDLLVTDADDTHMQSASVVLLNPQTGDALAVGSLPAGISYTTSTSGGVTVINFTGRATLADYQDAIKAITFSSTGNSTVERVLSVKVNDGASNSNTAYTTLQVTPDARALTAAGSTVNEASPYIMFEVTGAEGQWVALQLATTGSGSGFAGVGVDALPALQYFDGSTWVDYTGGLIRIPDTSANDGKLLVRAPVLQDAAYEGAETLKLIASNAAGVGANGVGTIRDDGAGSIYLAGNNTYTANAATDTGYPERLDDDRPVTVNSITVNEASPWAMFTVTGYAGQVLSLALLDGTAKVGDGTPADGSEDYGPDLQYWDGSTWTAYNGTSVTLVGTTLKVRAAIYQDTLFEGQHNFSLGVTQLASNRTVYGVGSIYDDGTGDIFSFSSLTNGTPTITSGPGAGFDDDRALTIDELKVNEGSDFAVFTLTGNSGQTVTLELANQSASINAVQVLKVWDGLAWVDYDADNLPTFDGNGKLFVRVDIVAEQDSRPEGAETFQLKAKLSGRTTAVAGVATIVDDGTGVKYDGTFSSGRPVTNTTALDHDREVLAAPAPLVAALPAPVIAQPALLPPEPPAPAALAFNSYLQPLAARATPAEALPPIGDVLTSSSGFRVTVNERATPGLSLNRGITDQYAEGNGSSSKLALPFDAFIHSDKDAVIKLDAKQADDSPLPSWVRFDPATGSFEVNPPKDFKGKLDLKVVAMDDNGREAVAMFRLFVADKPPEQRAQGRDSLSEKIRLAAKGSISLIRVGDAGKAAAAPDVVVKTVVQRPSAG